MSVLSSLAKAFDRLPDKPPFGYARTEVGFCIVLRPDGAVAFDPIDFQTYTGRISWGKSIDLPTPLTQRTSGIKPNFLWDKTEYSLGVTNGNSHKSREKFQSFVEFHERNLSGIDDLGFHAFLRFLRAWSPDKFTELGWPSQMIDTNVIFALESEYREQYLHQRTMSKTLWDRLIVRDSALHATCLVLGRSERIADSHPPIKGVRQAQSSGAFIVSFNDTAYQSYGHKSGDNAPVSENAAFKYTTALNRFLEKGSGHRLQIGDASTVFWADASDLEGANLAEAWGGVMLGASSEASESDRAAKEAAKEERTTTTDIRLKLKRLARGELLSEVEPQLAEEVRFYILGLSPNAARLSVRFFFEDSFGALAEKYVAYMQDMEFEPWPLGRPTPSIGRAVLRTAPARVGPGRKLTYEKERVSSLLAGELLRAILTGGAFPRSLLSLLILRVRNDGILDSIRIALIKALIVRSMRLSGRLPLGTDGKPRKDYLVRTDPDDPNSARRLGRLFAVIERAQLAALGNGINATVKDKFLAAAAATPQRVFTALIQNAQHHLKRLRNGHSDADWIKDAQQARRVGAGLDRDIGLLWGSFNDGLPVQHSSEEQGLFLVGYYQERFGGKANPELAGPDFEPTDLEENEEDAE